MSIIRAFTKLLKGENTELSKKRLLVCKDCDERCGVLCCNCGCYLKAKTRDEEEECPVCKNCGHTKEAHHKETGACVSDNGHTRFHNHLRFEPKW